VEQTIDELVNGHDLDHLITTRLHPNRIAVGFRLLARNLAIGFQFHAAQARPTVIREPVAFRATYVDGLGVFHREHHTLLVAPLVATAPAVWALPWTNQCVRLVA
jgi:hypothetical protein